MVDMTQPRTLRGGEERMEKDRITIQDDGASPATILRSGAGEVRLSDATEAAAAAGTTLTREEYMDLEAAATAKCFRASREQARRG